MKAILLVSTLLTGTMAATSAGLAEGTYGETHPRIHEINGRLRTQDARIDHGVSADRISAAKADTLHTEDAAIKTEEKTDESFDKGHLTKADQRALNQQLNQVSRQIGGRPRVHEVNTRLNNQNARIDHALADGQITAAQATALHAADASIKAEETTDRSFDKGHLTKADERALNQQLDDVIPTCAEADSACGRL